jgi:hypothetical protein
MVFNGGGGSRWSTAAGEVPCGSRREREHEGGHQSGRRRACGGAHWRGAVGGASERFSVKDDELRRRKCTYDAGGGR